MRKIQVNKKAQSLGGLYGGILVIASIGILLALVLYILSSFGDNMKDTHTIVSFANETTTPLNETGVYLTANALEDALCTITRVSNATTQQVWGAGNYTVTNCFIEFSTDVADYNNTAVNVTYSADYTASTTSSNATGTLVTQFVDFLPWIGIILLVLAAGVVLFFVIRSFAGGPGV